MATETTAGTLIEGLPLPVVVVARDARVIEANPLAVALFGEELRERAACSNPRGRAIWPARGAWASVRLGLCVC